jgi:tetratricopeptide (TPR) repeat protein
MERALLKVIHRNLAHALRSRQLDEAQTLLLQLQEEDPLSVETRGRELELTLKRGDIEEAETLSRQLLLLFPDSGRIHYLSGELAYRQKRYPAAINHFRESERIYPHWRSRMWLGKALTQTGALEEAEALLLEVAAEHPWSHSDLAWLYQRKGQPEQAIRELERHLQHFPNNHHSQQELQKLRAAALPPEQLQEEVEQLIELGEEVDETILPEYLQGLLRTGQGSQARRVVQELLPDLTSRTAVRSGWACRNLQAHDLAFNLLLHALPDAVKGDHSYFSILETEATLCRRLAELISHYERHAPQNRALYGRIKRLQQRLPPE